MPYPQWGDMNPTLKGIKPKITVEQGNLIASWADAIGGNYAWPTAISKFKKSYTVRRGKWVKRSDLKKEFQNMEPTLFEASKNAGDYLVVEDPEKPTTWHLQVKKNGKLDHKLMGDAWAALHKGFRGNTYEGPNKSAAITKLKKMYKDEDMEMPAESAEVEEYGDEVGAVLAAPRPSCVPYNAISFQQLDDMKAQAEVTSEVMELTSEYTAMVQNIFWSSDIPDKVGALTSLFDEFISKLGEAGVAAQSSESMKESLSEAIETEIMEFTELEPTESDKTCLHIDIIPIQPGWGNKRDNHYYPRPMLESCASRFIGAKMYESDHRDEEKSTKTWVSTITEMKGFTPDGAPIARVAVHNADFADRLRRLHSEGILNRMECSILANGTVKAGYTEGDRSGKVVEEISDVISVDWVTRAGAGGQVLSLVENEKEGGNTMPDEKEIKETPEIKPEEEKVVEKIKETEPVTPLAIAEVMDELKKTDLLPASQLKLLEGTYKDVAEIQVAVEAEKKYLSNIYQSGRVTGLGAVSQPKNDDIIKGVDEKKNALSKEAFGRK